MVSCGFGFVGCGEGLLGEEVGGGEGVEECGSQIGQGFRHCATTITLTPLVLVNPISPAVQVHPTPGQLQESLTNPGHHIH